MTRRALLPLAAAAVVPSLRGGDRLKAFGIEWSVPVGPDWQAANEGGMEVLKLVVARPQPVNPRRPFQYALAETQAPAHFLLEADVQRMPGKGSLIVVYAWQSPARFNYLHLSDDAAARVAVHNGVFHCFDGDRVRISSLEGPGTLTTDGWHRLKMSYNAASGLLEAWVDGKTSPSLKAVDLSLGTGRIGIGSFFNTANFRNLKISHQTS